MPTFGDPEMIPGADLGAPRYTERIAGEYFSRDGNMNLLFHVLGELMGQLGDSMGSTGVDILDTMLVPDGSKVTFNTYLTGMPPTAIGDRIDGFMDPVMPWWFSLQIRTYNAVPDSSLQLFSGDQAIAWNSVELADEYWSFGEWESAGSDATSQFIRLEIEDIEEWTGFSPSYEGDYAYINTNTTLDSWNWSATTTNNYPNSETATLWRSAGAKSIAYTDAQNYAYSSGDPTFAKANHFMSFVQYSQLTNWFDTVVSSDVVAAWVADELFETGTDLSYYGYQAPGGASVEYDEGTMVSIDDNMVLDVEDVDSITTSFMGEGYRTNAYQTSTYNPESFTADDDGINIYAASTSSETIDDLKIRYKQLSTSKTIAADFIQAQSRLVEATLYSSIGMKRHTTKMQRSTAMSNPYTIPGDPSAVSRDSTTTLDTNAASTIEETKSSAMTTTLDSAGSSYGGY